MRDPSRHRPRGQPPDVTLRHQLPPLSEAACYVRGSAYRAMVTERTSEISLLPEPPWVPEPPWGIEPQTYALRARFGVSNPVQAVPYPQLMRVLTPSPPTAIQGRC